MTFDGNNANLMQTLQTLLMQTGIYCHYKACLVCHDVQNGLLRDLMMVLAVVLGNWFCSK